MLLLIDGTPGSDITAFLARLHEETMSCTIMTYDAWLMQINFDSKSICSKPVCNDHEDPEGIIFMRVLPEIAHKRIQSSIANHAVATRQSNPKNLLERSPYSICNRERGHISLDQIKRVYAQKEELFIHTKDMPASLQQLPILVLNGNIDFQTDFSQFYNHLFYIRRLAKQVQEKKDIAQGIYKEKVHRKCC